MCIMKKMFKSIKSYFKGVKKEFSKIRWTSGKDMAKYSVATISFMVFFAAFFWLVDMAVSLVRSMA